MTAPLKILVVIANYGFGNQAHLAVVMAALRRMPFDLTIQVLSDGPKDFGPEVRVRVGLPGKSPWTLPFAYKAALAEHRDEFDLFIYTEDDMLVTERHVRAFLEVTGELPDSVIAGFTRFEQDGTGERYYIDMFRSYHFAPASIVRHGNDTFAKLTNEHAGCFMLTRAQLAHTLACPDFWRPPRKGYYGFPETAATEPYTQCGRTKVLCLSRLQDFALHHLPNKYWQKANHKLVTQAVLDSQIRAMCGPAKPDRASLIPGRLQVDSVRWDKAWYTPVCQAVLDRIPPGARTVLSIGCGFGATEQLLQARGLAVSIVPLDAVVASCAAERGLEVLPPDWAAALECLAGRRFDVVLLLDILQYVEHPVDLLKAGAAALHSDGQLLLRTPNFLHTNLLRHLWEGSISPREALKFWRYASSGLHRTSRRRVLLWLAHAGLSNCTVTAEAGEKLANHALLARWRRWLPAFLAARDLLFVARQDPRAQRRGERSLRPGLDAARSAGRAPADRVAGAAAPAHKPGTIAIRENSNT